MGCDYDWPTYHCKREDCPGLAKSQYSIGEDYDQLCDEHWQEQLNDQVDSWLGAMDPQETIRALVTEIILLHRRFRHVRSL